MLKSLMLKVTPSATQFFKRSYKISHTPRLQVSQDALPRFAALLQSAKIGLSKWIFYVKTIFDEVAKLDKTTQDAYNWGEWLIL